MTEQTVNLTNHFLIAMPTLEDPNFYHSVTYICEHSDKGALGIVINRVTDVCLGEVLSQMELEWPDDEASGQLVHLGGPVDNDRGFVLHTPVGHWDSSIHVTKQIALTTSRDILEAVSRHEGPDNMLIALGYAGWGEGQLEQEMAENAWISGPADPDIMFNLPPEKRWEAAAKSLGVDLTKMSNDIGHA